MERKSDQLLIENWWAETPFPSNEKIQVPIFGFTSGEYTGKVVELEHSVFNVPLRRDLIHRAYKYWRFKGYIRTHQGKNLNTVSGSNKKPFPQKKVSRARQGHKRAPRLKGGVHAHPKKMQIMEYYPLPKKVLLQSLKAIISARLAEGKLRVVDTEQIDEGKTRIIQEAIDGMTLGNRETFLMVTGYECCSNFDKGQRNIKTIKKMSCDVSFFVSQMRIGD